MYTSARKVIPFILILTSGLTSLCQKLELIQGTTQSLAKEQKVLIHFNYEDQVLKLVGEKSYWQHGGKETFETVFREMFSKYSNIQSVETKTSVTIEINVIKIDAGTSPEKMAYRKAFLTCSVKLVESNSPDSPMAVIQLTDIPGRMSNFRLSFSLEGGSNFNASAGARILASYSKAGKMLGRLISKSKN